MSVHKPGSPGPRWPANQFGNKTANLEILTELLGTHASVPRFFGIGHDAVMHYLGPVVGNALKMLQQQLSFDEARHRQSLSPMAAHSLSMVRASIADAFARQPGLPGGPDAATWLAQAPQARLMVRSTGAEDSELVANAGGNESVANVRNDLHDIKAAMVTVLQSYFSEKSFAQRYLAGDDVTGDAFVPVLLQIMVGEQPGGQVPSSGVMFTTEAEAFTPGVTQIQSTFGHNEAVVRSLLPVDTFLADGDAVHPIVWPKPERLVPTLDGTLTQTENPASLRLAPAISHDVVRRLRDIGQRISHHYDQPMDIEWTLDRDSDTIYLLQARPIVVQDTGEPTHLDIKAIAAQPSVRGDVIGAGGGTVREIVDASSVLLAPTLEQALQIFLLRGANSGAQAPIQAVFIAERAEATSHEATVFRGAQIPVILVREPAQVQTLLAEQGRCLLDPTSGLLVSGKGLYQDDVLMPGIVVDGWGKHPLPARQSVAAVALSDARLADFVRVLSQQAQVALPAGPAPLADLQAAIETFVAPERPVHPAQWLDAVRFAATPLAQARAWLVVLGQATRLAQSIAAEPTLARRAGRLLQHTVAGAARAVAAQQDKAAPLRALYELNWLQAVFAQQDSHGAIEADSFLGLLAEQKELRSIAKAQGGVALTEEDHAALALAARRFEGLAMRPEVAHAWRGFAAALGVSGEGRLLLAALMGRVQATGIAPLWMNVSFLHSTANAKAPEVVAVARAMLAELTPPNQSAQNSSDPLGAARRAASKWLGRCGEWAQPSQAQGLLKEFTQDVERLLIIEGPAAFAAASRTQKLMALSLLSDWVDTFDKTIKSVTGSPAFTAPQRYIVFSQLLGSFARMLPPWLAAAAPSLAGADSASRTVGDVAELISRDANELFVGLRKTLQNNPAALTPKLHEQMRKDLAATPGFNVSAAQIGSGAEFSQHLPRSMEDYFTTVHQSLLQVLAAANIELGLTPKTLPINMEKMVNSLLTSRPDKEAPCHIVGIAQAGDVTRVDLNWPMREHSLRIELQQDRKQSDHIRMQIDYFSFKNENYRLNRSLLAAGLTAAALGVSFAERGAPQYDAKRRVASWAWDIDTAGDAAVQLRRAVSPLIEYIDSTSYIMFDHVSLAQQFSALSQVLPGLPEALHTLPETFFTRMPWYNDDFFRYFTENGRTDVPAFDALVRAIDRKPPGQEDLWMPVMLGKEKSIFDPSANKLLAEYRKQMGLARRPSWRDVQQMSSPTAPMAVQPATAPVATAHRLAIANDKTPRWSKKTSALTGTLIGVGALFKPHITVKAGALWTNGNAARVLKTVANGSLDGHKERMKSKG